MTEPTPADRSAAHWLAEELAEVLDDASGLWSEGVDLIASALTIARETARAPFLTLAARLDDETREFYYENRHTHPYGIDYVSGVSDTLEQLADRIRAAGGAS